MYYITAGTFIQDGVMGRWTPGQGYTYLLYTGTGSLTNYVIFQG